jgi:hypothetical protein
MNEKDVKVLISRGEGQTTEFKSSFAEKREAVESLCAFAHSEGGTVLFGIGDDGRIIGASVGKRTIEDFANEVHQHTSPSLQPRLSQFEIDGHLVLAWTVEAAPADQLVYAYNHPYVRSGKTNQVIPPDAQRARLFSRFGPAENLQPRVSSDSLQSWGERDNHRKALYRDHRGLFLVHNSRPSLKLGQIADIVIFVRQHDGPDKDRPERPLTEGRIKSVEYCLGRRFFSHTVVKTDPADGFRLEISAYGPVLCIASINFDDGTPSIELERYIDF